MITLREQLSCTVQIQCRTSQRHLKTTAHFQRTFVLYFYFVLTAFPISGLFLNTFFLSSTHILKDDYKLRYASFFNYATDIC